MNTSDEIIQQICSENIKLKSINKEFYETINILSHDLRSPLRDIDNLSTFIEKNINSKKDIYEFIKKIKEKVKVMDDLIKELFKYFKIKSFSVERNTRRIEKENNLEFVDIKELINDIKKDICTNNISIKYEELPTIKTIKIKMHQLFYNLIQNSVKHHHNPNNILISIEYWPKEILGSNYINKDFWTFCVSDNGPGIDVKYHKKIFEKFTTKPDSLGIGLYIVKEIIKNFKGEIWCESEINKGCEFYFTLPKINTIC